MSKTFWIIAIVAVTALIGLFLLFNEPSETVSVDEPLEITEEDHTLGSEDAPLTLVKYSDFQCPACRDAAPVVKDILDEHGEDTIRFVYRHFNVTSPDAITYDAARASVAAKQQGAFWEMHDLLFDRRDDWAQNPDARDLFESYAEELELDMEEYQNDFGMAGTRVDRDLTISSELELVSTPTFYINDEQVVEPFSQLPEIVEAELAALEEGFDEEEDIEDEEQVE